MIDRRQLLAASSAALASGFFAPGELYARNATGNFLHLTYAGAGTVPVDSGLPHVGTIYAVARNGDLLWYRYGGTGTEDVSGSTGWNAQSSNPIGNGWMGFKHVLGGGDGIVLAVREDGDLLWYKYEGEGAADRSARTGWNPKSGSPIGNGWQNFVHLAVGARAGRSSTARLVLYAVEPNGDLRWYRYDGDGTADRTGRTGWHPNSGNIIGNGWTGFKFVVGSGSRIYGVRENGDLHFYEYSGNGEQDRTGATGAHPNNGNVIGNGWNTFQALFGGPGNQMDTLYGVMPNGDLRWYGYTGQGAEDRSGSTGWVRNSGNRIGNGW